MITNMYAGRAPRLVLLQLSLQLRLHFLVEGFTLDAKLFGSDLSRARIVVLKGHL